MPRVEDLYPSKSEWLKTDDVSDEGITATIDSYDIVEFNNEGKKQRKPVLFFKEDVKALVLNKTNAGTITQIVGNSELDSWIGTKITMVVREVEFAGKQTWAIRIQLPRRNSRSASGTQSPTGRRGGAGGPDAPPPPIDDDSIPF
jgi:hypothetical protein